MVDHKIIKATSMKNITFVAFAVALSVNVQAQETTQPIEDVNVLIYEKTSRLGDVGNFLDAIISKDGPSGQIIIDPFGLHPSKKNKNNIVKVCYVDSTEISTSDDDLIASNLKRALGADDVLYDRVGTEKITFKTFGGYQELGVGLIRNECDYIAVASTETSKVDQTIKAVDDRTDRTYKPIEDFKISSTKLWADPTPGKPISRIEYLSSVKTNNAGGHTGDALSYVLDKRWQLTICRTGDYQMFSRRFAGGHQYVVSNKGLNNNPQEFELVRIDSKSFQLKTTDYGNASHRSEGFRGPVAVTYRTVTLLNAKQIKIQTRDVVLDIVHSTPYNPMYLDNTKSSVAELCEG